MPMEILAFIQIQNGPSFPEYTRSLKCNDLTSRSSSLRPFGPPLDLLKRVAWPGRWASKKMESVTMSLQDFTNLAEIGGTIIVIISLIFVAYQIRQNTNQIQRNEHNQHHGTVVDNPVDASRKPRRCGDLEQGIARRGRIGCDGPVSLESLLEEQLWAAYHVWERTKRGILTERNIPGGSSAAYSWLAFNAHGGGPWVEYCKAELSSVVRCRCGRGL